MPTRLYAQVLTFILFLFLFALPTPPLHAIDEFTAKVIGISDGDTITVLVDGLEIKIRLASIDCPEGGQAFGYEAEQYTAKLVTGKTVTIQATGQDRYRRTIAWVILPDGRNLNHEIVRAGYGWWFRKYAPDALELEALESEAREDRRGLWADRDPVAPWEWRKIQQGQQIRPPVLEADGYHGNTKSMKFHRPGCPAYNCKNCTAVFQTREEAIKAGYEPCGECRP